MSEANAVPADGGQGGANGTPPAAPAEPTNVSPPAPPPEPEKPWYSGFENPELRGYVERKGWKDPASAINSYMNLEKLHGVPAERLLKLPESLDDAEAMAPIYEKLGLAPPKEAGDYGFTTLENADQDFAKKAEGWMHKHGVPPKYAKAIAAEFVADQQAEAEAWAAEMAETVAAEMGALKAEWGARYDDRLEAARRAVRTFGFTEEQLTAMEQNVGAGDLMRNFFNIGVKLGEASFVEGERKLTFTMTKEAAESKRNELMANKEWTAKYVSGDPAAKAEMARLNHIISGTAP